MTTTTIPRREQIVAAARALLEEHGARAVSMRNVAAEVGIRAPSLYEHVEDKADLENALIAAGLREQGDALAAATADADDPLVAAGAAWRTWAREHPHLYRLISRHQLDRSDPEVADAEQHAARAVRTLTGGDVVNSRVIWAFVHGFVMLELSGRMPGGPPADRVWFEGLSTLRPLVVL
jgi:AcrR family transcriptional regulator